MIADRKSLELPGTANEKYFVDTRMRKRLSKELRHGLLVLNILTTILAVVALAIPLLLKFVVASQQLATEQNEEQRSDTELVDARQETSIAAENVSNAQSALHVAIMPSLLTQASSDEVTALEDQVTFAKEQWRLAKKHQEEIENWASSAANDLSAAHAFNNRMDTILYVFTPVILLAFLILYFIIRRHLRRNDDRREEIDATLRAIEKEQEGRRSTAFEDLWEINRQQLVHYHRLVLNYAESSRRLTRLALTGGSVFLLTLATFALLANTVFSAISSSVVAAVGAIATGYVVRAILRNSENSSRELWSFFSHPIEVERALAAERLIGTMPPHEQARATLVVVNSLTRERRPENSSSLDTPPSPALSPEDVDEPRFE